LAVMAVGSELDLQRQAAVDAFLAEGETGY
jgi:hypothetical protein